MDNFVYKNSEELKNLGFSDFIKYCNCVNRNLEKPSAVELSIAGKSKLKILAAIIMPALKPIAI